MYTNIKATFNIMNVMLTYIHGMYIRFPTITSMNSSVGQSSRNNTSQLKISVWLWSRQTRNGTHCHYTTHSTYMYRKASFIHSAEPFSHGTGTLRCLQKEMATYRH